MEEAATYTSLIKIGRIFDASTLAADVNVWADYDEEDRPDATFYQRGALQLGRDFLHRDRDDPVVIDHDLDRQIGVVTELFEFPDTDGYGSPHSRGSGIHLPGSSAAHALRSPGRL